MDCFDLIRDIRELDMRASPYDLSEFGYTPVRIETLAGQGEYAAAQRGFAARGQALRERLLAAIDALRRQVGAPACRGTAGVSAPARPTDQAVGHALDEGVPGGLDDVPCHAHGLPRGLAVGGLDEHAGDGVGAVRGIEDAHSEVDQLELVELGVGRGERLAQRVVERIDRCCPPRRDDALPRRQPP